MKKEKRQTLCGGLGTEYITDKEIEALKSGKRLWLSVNDEYAVVIRYVEDEVEK